MIRQRLTGLAATLGLLVLLIGLPWLLLQVGFGTLPTITSSSDLIDLLLRRDDGSLALVVIKAIGWITWALLAGLIGLEIVARLRGLRPRDLPGLGVPQLAARQLVAAAAALFVALPTSSVPAHADTVPTPIVAPISQTAAYAGDATPRRASTVSAPAAAVDTRPYLVTRGESLWSIAKKELGSGRRYTEIAALNTTLLEGKGDAFLRPGWTLQLPTDAGEPGAASAVGAATSYTVKKGDTLSEIALDHYGDATAYPRIAEASRPFTQPGGGHLTDPDVIDVGWTLTIPDPTTATVETPAKPGEPPAPESVTAAAPDPRVPPVSPPQVPASAPSSVTPSPVKQAASASSSEVEASPTVTVDDDTTQEVDAEAPGWLLGGLAGAGALLGGSMWLALQRRRAAQFRSRRPGRMIATPPPELAPVEKTLATAGAAAVATVEFLDEALRRLATRQGRAHQPMPVVAAAELAATQLRLHLSQPEEPPAPWTISGENQLLWELPTGVDLDQVGPLDPGMQAPYPQLVTVGSSDDGDWWLLNLEDTSAVRLTGDPDYVRDFARHVAASLALQPWSVDVRIECVGIASEIVALNPRRVRHHDPAVEADIAAQVLADAVDLVDRSTQAGMDVATGRATLLEDDLWDSRLLLLDTNIRPETVTQLVRLLHSQPGRTGTALLVVHHDTVPAEGEEIHLTGEGRLIIPSVGLDLVAVGLTSGEANGCAALIAQADDLIDVPMPGHSDPVEGWQAHANQAGQLLPDLTLPRHRDEDAGEVAASVLPEPDEAYLEVAATTPDELAALAPQVPVRTRDRVEQADPTLDDEVRTWFDTRCDLPKLKVLGPVTVRVAQTGQPTQAASRQPFLTELLAYLATHPGGATTEEIADAMRIQPQRVRKHMVALRAWLGTNPRTGRLHVPNSRQTAAAKDRGSAAYQVEGLLMDADLFRRLRVRGEARGPEGLDDLRQALGLVTGTPFADLRVKGGAWLADGDRLDQILLCGIVDVAHLVAVAALQRGELADAQRMAELALRVAPNEETPRLDLAAALRAQGHHHAAEQLLHEGVFNRSDDEDELPTEPPARTTHILSDHRWLDRPRTRTSA